MKICRQTCSDSLQNLEHSSGIYISELQQAEMAIQTAVACGVANASLSFRKSLMNYNFLMKVMKRRTFQIRF